MYNQMFENVADMATYHPGSAPIVSATILGFNWPVDEDFAVYVWDYSSSATPDGIEVVIPTTSTDNPGRWLRVSLAEAAQVNSDWNSSTGVSKILNKPTLATVATTGVYSDLIGKPTIPTLTVVGTSNSRTLSLATAYQATDNTKPAIVTITLTSTASITLTAGTTIVGEVREGSSSSVATGGGTAIGAYINSITGTLVIGANISTASNQTITFALPAGHYFAVRQTSGSGLSIVSAFDQALSIS